MSETVHYRGRAIAIAKGFKTCVLMAKKMIVGRSDIKKIPSYYDDYLDYLCDYYDDFYYHEKTETLYQITKHKYDLDDDIIKATINEYGTIDYELRYYNGGAGFGECLTEAFDKL